MTVSPHSIGKDQTLTTAHALMRQHHIRHLPVLDGGSLVGVVSQRDLYLLETLDEVDLDEVTVEEAMSQEVYCVTPTTTLREVAEQLIEHKYGCAIVMQGRTAAGIFTTIDALQALLRYLPKQT